MTLSKKWNSMCSATTASDHTTGMCFVFVDIKMINHRRIGIKISH